MGEGQRVANTREGHFSQDLEEMTGPCRMSSKRSSVFQPPALPLLNAWGQSLTSDFTCADLSHL